MITCAVLCGLQCYDLRGNKDKYIRSALEWRDHI